ncbi:phosphohistidine phosphatase SixA [Sinobacterium caligoides]|uniref:Phosphohistidine phosphatase SixA n=2 Tax=Sinobacterium caligoides TaxID=933926 RepID=A0A3N2DMI8_9GAMM|nr:phosphohistidine phosphatase SixA [Sinobacterium caligoides]
MRHGEAAWDAPSDELRPLTERGQKLSSQVAGRLLEANELALKPERLIVSPYLRAQQTADCVLSVIGGVPKDHCELITPDGNPREVIEWLYGYVEQYPKLQSLMLITHNPFVSDLISLLVDGQPRRGDSALPVMDTSTLVLLETDLVAVGCCTLLGSYRA